ncbi:uncharacterized protein CC84DRAFT_1093842 [Paraphaeosphaeria sporulosa]|uniref:CFEM domain-containing protein n=1 Tax=Paraphaeosphaeria sporulosa TaxID=1460663 RepID=A0A177CEL9_9PLEO|nr:uncharacterized protein CC84DRAFT_1093842 [Paraphaeosphaeria sporulosa]OAG05249.1 hypothetical protein CC84DRAFT_1093842 [Paraphaeosphaeria sporulosa]
MKSFAILAVVGVALAQDAGSLPQCGQTCVNNMIAIAQSSFGCSSGDVACYCSNQDFGYGVRDCAREACGSDAVAAQVISYGATYCAGE